MGLLVDWWGTAKGTKWRGPLAEPKHMSSLDQLTAYRVQTLRSWFATTTANRDERVPEDPLFGSSELRHL